MNTKPWWKSKTVWFNVLSAVVLLGGGQLGIHIPPNVAVPMVTAGNVGLRLLTNQGLAATAPVSVP